MSQVSLHNLRVAFDGKTIIDGLDLHVEEGEFLVLLGPSGCGKSTLLHSIAGLLDVDGGRVEISGRDMTHTEPSERGIGMVFQSYALYPAMSVEKNMSFGLRMAGMPKDEIARRVSEAARMLQLEPLLDRKPAQLSGGQRQRVAIGRALVRQAQVLLFDEPLSNLDAKLRTELRRELKLLHQRLGATMIYVTHDQVEAMTLATRIVVMRDGKIQQIGTPAEVYRRPANLFVAGFLGAPAINLFDGRFAHGRVMVGSEVDSEVDSEAGHDTGALEFDTGIAIEEGAEVVVGIRPEHIRIDLAGSYVGKVTLAEPMGNHQVVWIDAGQQTLSLLAPPEQTVAVGDSVMLTIDTAAAMLFDRASGLRLSLS